MRTLYCALLISMAIWHHATAQKGVFPDTLIIEPVIGDPVSFMLPAPSGFDIDWVNYDQDMVEGFCVESDVTPNGWFIESDFGFLDPTQTTNDVFTSCSYLQSGIRNHNWLILPPIYIPDDTYQLCWRSLVSEGPAFTDGYKVLASTASNLPGDFNDVLFTAAEMIKPVNPNIQTLNPADYIFSAGYIHANTFTDTNYFFLLPPNGPYRGRLEPHCVSLSGYAEQAVYIAFHHDSKDDSQLQLDDINISKNTSSAVYYPSNVLKFNVSPNPVVSGAYVNWTMRQPEAGRLLLHDLSGRLVMEKQFSAYEHGQFFLPLEGFASGVYQCSIQTPSGQSTIKLAKM